MVSVPLQGFLASESDASVSVEVPGGRWVVPRSDIESMTDWKDPVGAGSGQPVEVYVRPGAVLDYVQPIRVEPVDRPMTLPDELSRILGSDQLREMGETWAGRLGFTLAAHAEGTTPSGCCWETGDWGIDCQADDSKD